MAEVNWEWLKFLGIMFLGALIAISVVAASRPSEGRTRMAPPLDLPNSIPNDRNAEAWQFQPNDEIEFSIAVDLHQDDPLRNPFPSPVPPKINDEFS